MAEATVVADVELVGYDDPRWGAAGVTYRRLHLWTTNGYLVADSASPGSGYARLWPVDQVEVAARMVRLTDAGLSVAAAAKVARAPYGTPVGIARGVVVMLARPYGVAS